MWGPPPCVWQLTSQLEALVENKTEESSDVRRTISLWSLSHHWQSSPSQMVPAYINGQVIQLHLFWYLHIDLCQSNRLSIIFNDDHHWCDHNEQHHRWHQVRWSNRCPYLATQSHNETSARRRFPLALTHTHRDTFNTHGSETSSAIRLSVSTSLISPHKEEEVAWPQLPGPRRPTAVPSGVEMTGVRSPEMSTRRGRGGMWSDQVSDHRPCWQTSLEGCAGFGFWFAAD